MVKQKPERVGRQRSCDILPLNPQPSTLLPPASVIESIRDGFHVLFTDEMTELVINNTNDKIRHIKENLPPHFVESNKNTYVRLLDQEEFYAFIGLLYARGLLGQSMHTYKIFFLILLDIKYSLQQCPSTSDIFECCFDI